MSFLWKKIYDEYFERFGMGEHLSDILEKKREIALLKCKKGLLGDSSIDTMISIAELELNEFEQIKGGNFLETKAYIEKTLNFQIDLKKTSVSEYYTYLKLITKENG